MTLSFVIGLLMLILIAVALVEVLTPLILKLTAHRRNGAYWFMYRGIPRRLDAGNLEDSEYWNLFPKEKDFEYGATIDDWVMKRLATNIRFQLNGKSDRYIAGYVLAFVQQNCTYRKDSKTYGQSEMYEFPICTLYLRGVDCEGVTFLGAGLTHMLGIDTAIIHVKGHVAYGVAIEGSGTRFIHDGKSYLWCEGTGLNPIGWHINTKSILGTYSIEYPPFDYRETGTISVPFSNFKT